jgi:hydrogenase nickel incorporation protein HypA/HybF
MHEMSLCEGILDSLRAESARSGFDRVLKVRLEIGRFACVEPDALRFGFDVVTRGSLAEGAALEIDRPPGRALCFDCGRDVELNERLDPCPACGGARLVPTGGDEMRIRDLEVI